MEIKSRLPKMVGDERLLKRSLEEVLDNAVKFSPNGGTIRLEVKGVAAGNGQGKRRGVAVTRLRRGDRDRAREPRADLLGFPATRRVRDEVLRGPGPGACLRPAHHRGPRRAGGCGSKPDEGTCFTITCPEASATSQDD